MNDWATLWGKSKAELRFEMELMLNYIAIITSTTTVLEHLKQKD